MGHVMLKNLALTAALAATPLSALAVTITGQIDISGTVNLATSDFTSGGFVDLDDPGSVIFATGSFASVATGTAVMLWDVSLSAPGPVWSVGGFTYTASNYDEFSNATQVGFTSKGLITGSGFDATPGMLNFSANPLAGLAKVSFSSTTAPAFTQSTTPVPLPTGLLLIGTALAGLSFATRRA